MNSKNWNVTIRLDRLEKIAAKAGYTVHCGRRGVIFRKRIANEKLKRYRTQ